MARYIPQAKNIYALTIEKQFQIVTASIEKSAKEGKDRCIIDDIFLSDEVTKFLTKQKGYAVERNGSDKNNIYTTIYFATDEAKEKIQEDKAFFERLFSAYE